MSYLLLVLIHFEVYALVALSLNLLVGYTGLLHVAQIAYVGIGAYAYALASNAGAGFAGSMLAAVAAATVASLLVSLPACRFRGHSFVMVSLAAQVGLFAVFYNWVSVTGGPFGLSGLAKPSVLGSTLEGQGQVALMFGVITALLFGLTHMAMRGPFGRNLKAVRDDELAARSIGISPSTLKIQAFAVASGIAGAAGAMYAANATYIDPTLYSVDEAILVLAMVLVGGSGNMIGPLVGAVVMVGLPEALRFLDVPTLAAANLRAGIFGLALVIMMRLRPQGLAGVYRFE